MSKKKENTTKKFMTLSEIRPVKQVEEAYLLKFKGVTGVDIGYKFVGGKKTDELAIRVYVEEKKDVPPKERIPKTVKGIKTDVIQRRFKLHPLRVHLNDLEIKADTGTYDPVQGGISIGPCRSIGGYVYTGTLGAIVLDNDTGDPMLLSNFHVMCVDDQWSVGDTMAQPSRVDGGVCNTDVVGTLQRASLGGRVDCAVSSLTGREHLCSIVDIGAVMYPGTASASEDQAVRKRGRTTGLTHGTVDTVDLTVSLNYGDNIGVRTLTNQIGIDVDTSQSAQFGLGGDSGSVVVDDDRKVVGLYFAGNMEETDAEGNITVPEGTYGVANPIQDVLDALDVRICARMAKKREPDKWSWMEGEWLKEYEKWKERVKELEKGKEWEKRKERAKERFKDQLPFTEEVTEAPVGTVEDRLAKLEANLSWIDPEYCKPEWRKPEQIKPEARKPEAFKPELRKPEMYKPELMKPEYKPPPIHGGSPEERLARLEAAFTQLTHFIKPEHRPDLSKSALRREGDT
ncbi:hypothetical protein H8E65_01940 [Candidatus Bathyarchaeota archaeon]|nr:hypothetical protein [Candidatus Bathyarchaeota archaeon]MBL7080804.1 hypothetical protein [Candidatus Bathyarchaeota archaeon]